MEEFRVQMDDGVRFSGTKYEKGTNQKLCHHYKCGERERERGDDDDDLLLFFQKQNLT